MFFSLSRFFSVETAGRLVNCLAVLRKLLPGRRKRVIILKNDGLGDLIIFLPYIDVIRRHYNALGYETTLMVREPWKSLAEKAGCADRILVQPAYKNPLQWLFFRLSFWAGHCFDIVIEGVCEAHDIIECCFCKTLINIYLDEKWKALPRKGVISCDVSNLTIHERYRQILNLCGIRETEPAFDYEQLCAPVPRQWIAEPFCLVCPDSNDPRKCWEEEKYAHIIDRICQTSSLKIILTGCDSGRNRRIISLCSEGSRILDMSGKTDLFQLFSLVRNAALLLTNDTGCAHAGAALKCLTFVICGKGEYGTFFPYPEGIEGKILFSVFSESPCPRCFWRDDFCTQLPVYCCLSEISTSQVWDCMMANGAAGIFEKHPR